MPASAAKRWGDRICHSQSCLLTIQLSLVCMSHTGLNPPSQLYEMYTPTMPILQKRTRGNRNDAQASQYWMNFILFHLIGVGTGCVGGGTREGFVERASGGWVSLDSWMYSVLIQKVLPGRQNHTGRRTKGHSVKSRHHAALTIVCKYLFGLPI